MPKRDIPGFIAHWSAANPSERADSADVSEILQTLVTLGRARKQGGKFTR